jgi:hypothetical protein
MNLSVNVTVDFGERTMNFLTGGIFAPKQVATVATIETAVEQTEKPKPAAAVELPAPKAEETPVEQPAPRKRRTQAEIAAEKEAVENGWDEMSEDDQLEAIKNEITKHAKKGKSTDIKFMLAQFDAERAGLLNPEDYKAFFDAIQRYGNGDSVTDIFPE